MARGTLVVNARKQLRIKWKNAKGKDVEMAVPDAELSAPLKTLKDSPTRLAELNGREVELDEIGGQPRKVRPVDEVWKAPPLAGSADHSDKKGRKGDKKYGKGAGRADTAKGKSHVGREGGGAGRSGASRRGEFHNPYNFVPAVPREHVTGDLGDSLPIGHERYHDERISGVISVKLTVDTPLLIPDAGSSMEYDRDDPTQGVNRGHKTFPVRTGPDGRPYLAPTSIKGMLRAAYEAVTNSRMGVFVGHDDRLALRMPAGDGLALVPARVEDDKVVLYLGTTQGFPVWNEQGARWNVPGDLAYAAWLPRYRGRALRYVEGGDPQHGDQVCCWLEKFQHWRWDRNARTHKRDFKYWRTVAISRSQPQLGKQPDASQPGNRRDGRSHHEPLGEKMIRVSGYVSITNQNIRNKHDERVFFAHGQQPIRLQLAKDVKRAWRELILNYQSTHEKDLEQRRRRAQRPDQYLGDEPGKTAWSRHVYEKSAASLDGQATCCYAFVEKEPNGLAVRALYPVMISRKLHRVSPLDLLPDASGLRPARSRSDLSPADRVFGWVNADGHGAYRGNLRIGPVACETNDAVVSFGTPGLPLAILGQPKAQQARFYAADSPNGEAQPDGEPKEAAGYRTGKGLRGRKVYPHHASLRPADWQDPLRDRSQEPVNGQFQEYRRPHKPLMEEYGQRKRRPAMNDNGTFRLLEGDENEQRDDQNRSVQAWVRSGAHFTFDLHITNLSQIELGALLWLVSLNEGVEQPKHFHRLGGGKPLGFGSVQLDITTFELRAGVGWRAYYQSLGESTAAPFDVSDTIKTFKQAVVDAYGAGSAGDSLESRFRNVPFIAAFLRAAAGFADGLPIHYPRARQDGQQGPVPPHPDSKAYEWFVANDRTGRNAGPAVSLPDLPSDEGLPILEAT